jgi:hypothetical protein
MYGVPAWACDRQLNQEHIMITRSANTFLHRKTRLIRMLPPVLSAVALLAASGLAAADGLGVADSRGPRIVFANGASNAQPTSGKMDQAAGTELPDLGGDVVITEPRNAPASRPSMGAAPATTVFAGNGPMQLLVPGALVTMHF